MQKTSKPAAKKTSPIPLRNVVSDSLDLRDRPCLPSIAIIPAPQMAPRMALPVLHQKQTSACTGFALSNVVNFLIRQREPKAPPVSPFMIYSMARRYDEFPGATADTGSNLRGAMKGWYRHGVCKADLWRTLPMPGAAKSAADDGWLDAATRPLGAYYRVDRERDGLLDPARIVSPLPMACPPRRARQSARQPSPSEHRAGDWESVPVTGIVWRSR